MPRSEIASSTCYSRSTCVCRRLRLDKTSRYLQACVFFVLIHHSIFFLTSSPHGAFAPDLHPLAVLAIFCAGNLVGVPCLKGQVPPGFECPSPVTNFDVSKSLDECNAGKLTLPWL